MTSTADRDAHSSTASAPGGLRVSFIVACARSGSTLLQHILDAHPMIACPGESGVPSLARALARTWLAATAGSAAERSVRPPPEVVDVIRSTLTEPLSYFCRPGEKAMYCDKSLDSVECLPLLAEIFPTAKYVLLFRHVMDTIASGLEASPFGLEAYGYASFAQRSPTNAVEAIASAWTRHVGQALAWEAENSSQCHRVYYEELVSDEERVVAELHDFLEAPRDPGSIGRALHEPHHTHYVSPGDYKLPWTRQIHSASLGQGKRIPLGRLHPALIADINAKLDALGYRRLHARWNFEPWSERGIVANSPAGSRLREMMSAWRCDPFQLPGDLESVAVIADDAPNARWVIDPHRGTAIASGQPADFELCGRAEDLAYALNDVGDASVALWSGRLRGAATPLLEERRPDADLDLDQISRAVVSALRSGARP